MLVLTRRDGQRVRIGDDVWVTIDRADRGRCHVCIEAPPGVRIAREELLPPGERYAAVRRPAGPVAYYRTPPRPDAGHADPAGPHHTEGE